MRDLAIVLIWGIFLTEDLHYLFMVLTMKQTAHGLVPEDIAVQLGEEVLELWVLPPTFNAFFQAHLENMSLSPLGLQAAHNFDMAYLLGQKPEGIFLVK